jgi:hypothetical protein
MIWASVLWLKLGDEGEVVLWLLAEQGTIR